MHDSFMRSLPPDDGHFEIDLHERAFDHLNSLGPKTFGQGRYQVLSIDVSNHLSRVIAPVLPDSLGRGLVFGASFGGKLFFELSNREPGVCVGVYSMCMYTSQLAYLAPSVPEFYLRLAYSHTEWLDETAYQSWVQDGGNPPALGECVGRVMETDKDTGLFRGRFRVLPFEELVAAGFDRTCQAGLVTLV